MPAAFMVALSEASGEAQARECELDSEVTGTCSYMGGRDQWSKQPQGLAWAGLEAESY